MYIHIYITSVELVVFYESINENTNLDQLVLKKISLIYFEAKWFRWTYKFHSKQITARDSDSAEIQLYGV